MDGDGGPMIETEWENGRPGDWRGKNEYG